jgi:hypothetical protein
VATKSSYSWEDGFNACRGLHTAMQREASGQNADGSKKKAKVTFLNINPDLNPDPKPKPNPNPNPKPNLSPTLP